MYLPTTKFHVRGLFLAPSAINGRGMHTLDPIKPGTVVMTWGGMLVTRAQLRQGVARLNSIVQVNDGRFLVDPADGPPALDEFINHSCDPNLWMAGDVTLAARRPIDAQEELTIDYGTYRSIDWVLKPAHTLRCACGTDVCRSYIRGDDHLSDPSLQERFRNHFAPYLAAEIAKNAETRQVPAIG